MRIPRTCKVCGEKFIAIKVTQFYCRRKCFKRAYYIKTKDFQQDEENHHHYPTKKCEFCHESSELNFDPLTSPEKFNAWFCPHCGTTNRLVWEYQHNTNSYEIISNILVTIEMNPCQLELQTIYEPFLLPVVRPGIGNPNILTMTCELLSISDTQKHNRKKLLFS
jgi:hypothetical protein